MNEKRCQKLTVLEFEAQLYSRQSLDYQTDNDHAPVAVLNWPIEEHLMVGHIDRL